ncbi:MAG: carboxypeptidase-like regulatory domain-containing protein, partial [Planctomycetota bacterium]|nr:carboxypeptidase-like regulatory domain-containing protein [Planctomycetota bacterium]
AAVVFTTQSEKKKGTTARGSIQTKAVTDAQGRYRIDDAPLGRITGVQALAEGFLPHMERAADLEAQRRIVDADKPLTLDLTLSRGGAVRGRVTDQETGAAIPGATVHLHAVSLGRAGNAEPPRSVVADANGRYRFDAVGIGRYVTLPSADGYYLPQLKPQGGAVGGIVSMPMGPGASAPPAVTVVMTAEGLEVERDLALAKGHRVAGSVVDADGQGVRGAEVFARGYGLQSIGWQWGLGGLRREPLATSGSGGRFTIEGLPPKGDWVLYAKKDGYAGVFAKPFAVDEDTKAADVTLKLEPGATVRGRVVDEDGRGVTAVTVGYWGGTQETAGGRNSAQTDAEGRFELKGMPAGDFTLNVRVPGSRGKQHPLKDLKAGEVREGIVLELAAGVEVSGVIVDKDGEPVTGLMLLLQSLGGVSSWNQTMTSRNGTFSFNAASAGRVQLMTWTGGQQTRLGEPFNAPATNVRLVYERLPTIMLRGEVQRPDGTPVPLASVRVQGAPTNGPIAMDMSGMGGTDAVNGAFERAVTGKGPWSVVVTAARDEQGRPLNLQPKTVKVTDPAERIIVKLERGLEVAGVVVDDEGKGIAGVTVTAKSRTQTNAQGRFRIGGLGKGKIQVAVMPPSGFVRPPTQNVEAGTTDLRFELVEGLAITGTAYAPDGKPVAQGFVSGTWNDAAGARRGNASTRIQSDGKFRLGGIPRGVLVRLQVQIWDPTAGASVAPKVIEDVRPGTTELEVRLGGGLTIEGTVLGTDGKPAENCWVYGRAVEGGQDTGWVQVGSDGSWKLTGLKPGRYSIQVMRMGGQAAPAPMEVDAPARGVRIQLPKTASLAGRITGISTEGQRWIVILRDEAGQHIASAIVQPDGSWRASTVREGANVWVHASSSTSDRYVRHGPVQAGREDIATAARTGKAITGLLEGLPEGSRGMVWAEGERGWRSSGTVGQDGTFTIRGVPPGGYVVKARTTNSSHDGETRGVTDGAKDVRVLMNPRAAR